ncbi:hypothetical protein B0T17DRAFT_528614 [Bombardia bombarda]|uniref:Peptidase metallopeptidase domain-containing protein n=1 Tax=Bombardia bombarda TaxID=252184 RepID=A0AA39XAU6_9PEZI|nr:hypothetical protein B0T17DRAFT_528614 [Bombardia bombarda]
MKSLLSLSTLLSLYLFSFFFYAVTGCPPPGSSLMLRDGTIIGEHAEWLRGENGTRLTRDEIDKRSMHVISGKAGFGRLWEGNTAIYCFAGSVSNDDRTILRRDLTAAWELWTTAGIDARIINFREATVEECEGPRNTYIQIVVPKKDSLSSSLGNTGTSRMTLSTNPDMAMGDRVGNYAHEIGHVFGLMHEHQRPEMWSTAYGGTADHNSFIWNCANLADYAEVLGNADEETKTRRCQTRDGAAGGLMDSKSLSATNWLPVPASNVVVAGDFDMTSIMIYATEAGGYALGGGLRAPVYTLANGDLLHYNHAPSAGDIAAINDLYPAPAPDPQPCMLYDACSPFRTAYEHIKGCVNCQQQQGNHC